MKNRDLGKLGEEMAAAHLTEKGYRILERNYRCPLGEVDLVARDGETLVFVEVKSRSSLAYGYPQEGVTASKKRKLEQLAVYYMGEKGWKGEQCRFDVAAVRVGRRNGKLESIDIITDAF